MQVAIKIYDKSNITTDDQITRFTLELSLLKRFRHPFIAEFYEHLEDDDCHYYVMEYAECGSLASFIAENGAFSEAQARFYFSQLVSVLEYLHTELCVVHRDLKTENVLLDRNNNIRVIDFGLSKQFSATHPLLNTTCGSPTYASPEMIKGQPYSQACDVWSAGIFLFSILVGRLPFEDDNLQRLLQKIVYTEIDYPPCLSPAVLDLLRKLLAKNPEMRITIDKIKEHHWFSQIQYSALQSIRHSSFDTAQESGIDKELVDRIQEIGLDPKPLFEQLLNDEFTELTAVYRILERDRLTNSMKEVMRALQAPSSHGRTPFMPLRIGQPDAPKVTVNGRPPKTNHALPASARSPGRPRCKTMFSPKAPPPLAIGQVPSQTSAVPRDLGNPLPVQPALQSQVAGARKLSRPMMTTRMSTTSRDGVQFF
jgi:serine/threonine protein kinase